MNTTTINRAICCAVLAAAPLGLILAAPAMQNADTVRSDNLRAWVLFDKAEAEGLTADHRLVGLACGTDRLTMTAIEEDIFPTCDTIDTPENLCGYDQGDLPSAAECARYMGDGW